MFGVNILLFVLYIGLFGVDVAMFGVNILLFVLYIVMFRLDIPLFMLYIVLFGIDNKFYYNSFITKIYLPPLHLFSKEPFLDYQSYKL